MLFKCSLGLLLISLIHCSGDQRVVNKKAPKHESLSEETKRLQVNSKILLKYAQQKKFAADYAFLIDMNLNSGSNRFFVYSFEKNTVIRKGLVTHGNCGESFLTENRYGNTVGCNCTSLGKYKIGKKYYGRFGLAYKLHGLDKTNNKAFERFVVLHAHSCVPDFEVSPYPICQSNGCPTVSPDFLETLASFIDKSKQPVLLWIYE